MTTTTATTVLLFYYYHTHTIIITATAIDAAVFISAIVSFMDFGSCVLGNRVAVIFHHYTVTMQAASTI